MEKKKLNYEVDWMREVYGSEGIRFYVGPFKTYQMAVRTVQILARHPAFLGATIRSYVVER